MAKSEKASSARAVAWETLTRVDGTGAYVNLQLDALLSESTLDARDRAFATELAYGTLRWQGRIDWVLSHYVQRPLAGQHARVRNLLRLAAYQLLFLRNIPSPVVVYESVELAKRNPKTRHVAAFVNAVARRVAHGADKLSLPSLSDDPIAAIATMTSHPRWMVERWIRQYGAQRVQSLMQANNEPAPLFARANRLRCTAAELVAAFGKEGVEAVVSDTLPDGVRIHGAPGLGQLPSFQDGMFTAQDEGSQLVGHVVDPQPGDVVWDVCSAPGTKTTHLAELMGDSGQVIATDIHAGRLALVRQAANRLGLKSIAIKEGDARVPPGEPSTADRVLVDAPCSGVGVLRRRPDLRWRRDVSDMETLIRLQRDILLGAATLVRPGGVLVYSTCSVDSEENVDNVKWFLKAVPAFRPASLIEQLPAPLVSSLGADRLRDASMGYVQLWPDRDGTDGFFISRLVKTY